MRESSTTTLACLDNYMIYLVSLFSSLAFILQFRVAFKSSCNFLVSSSVSIVFLLQGLVPLLRSLLQLSGLNSFSPSNTVAESYLLLSIQYFLGVFVFYAMYEIFPSLGNIAYVIVAPLTILKFNLRGLLFPIRLFTANSFRRSEWSFYCLSAVFLLLLLTSMSSSGLLWILTPRTAYIEGRNGVGLIWVLYSLSCSMLGYKSFVSNSNACRLSTLAVLKFCVAAILSFFSGSKGVFVMTCLLGILPNLWIFIGSARISSFGSLMHSFFKAILSERQPLRSFLVVAMLLLSSGLFVYSIYSLSASGLQSYIGEQQFFAVQLDDFSRNPQAIVFPGYVSLTAIYSVLPSFLRPEGILIGNQLIYDRLIPGAFELGNTPVFDPVIHQVYIYGIDLVFLGGFVSAFSSNLYYMFLRAASSSSSFGFYNVFNDKMYPYFIAFGVLPLVPPQFALIFFQLLP